MASLHYLDHAATSPVPRAVADEVYRVLTECYGNPSAQYPMGEQARQIVAQSRETIAQAMGCRAEELIFTSGGTESDNWAIMEGVRQGRHIGRHIITSAVEHGAVLQPCKHLREEGYDVTFLKPDREGNITPAQVMEALRDDTVLISLMMVNNETGCVFPVAELAGMLRARGSRALLHTDAVQGFMKLPFRADTLGADMITVSGHKLGAPKGIGALYISSRIRGVLPMIRGGGQEQGLRSGTEATAQIAGFAKAVALHAESAQERGEKLQSLKRYAIEKLLTIEGVKRIGNGTAPHILLLTLPGYPAANVITELGAAGICISAGASCHRGKLSHVLTAMGLPKKEAAGALRISFDFETDTADIDALYAALSEHQKTRFPML